MAIIGHYYRNIIVYIIDYCVKIINDYHCIIIVQCNNNVLLSAYA